MRRSRLALIGSILAGVWLTACMSGGGPSAAARTRDPARAEPPQPAPTMAVHPLAYAYVVVSVADMDQALGLWVDRFGMELVTRRDGRDAALAAAWGLRPEEIIDQALLRTPGVRHGGLHLVRFRIPGPAVRDDAAPTDLVPKSIDIAVRDIEARYEELSVAGYRFRSPVNRLVTASGIEVFETHMLGPDGLNLVLLEQPAHPEPVSPKGYGVAPQVVVIASDNLRESSFWQSLLGLEQISHNRFGGPAIEKTVGLPRGAQLDIRIMGDSRIDYGRIEIVQYEGVAGRNLYPRARPPARGMLSVTYFVPELDSLIARGASLGVRDLGAFDGVYGTGRIASATTPAGLRVDLFEPVVRAHAER
jgi:catechol 2,3-dioxygenase-like lactoylglutathione lyase family enzyme